MNHELLKKYYKLRLMKKTMFKFDKNQQFLELRNVDHTYPAGAHALRGVSIGIPEGQVFGLLGSNGCGKSTLMGCLTNCIHPDCGEALLR